MKISGRTQVLPKYSLYEALGVIKKCGFDGVEICLDNLHFELKPDLLDDYVIRHNRERTLELGLDPVSISFHADYVNNDFNFDSIKRAITKTRDYGTDILIISNVWRRLDDSSQRERLVGRLKELTAVAEVYGIRLALEPEPGFLISSTEDMQRLMDEVPSDSLACNLDLGHAFLCDEDPLVAIKSLGSKVVHCHIENMRRGIHQHLIPQEGDMDLSLYVKVLEEISFKGAMALDLAAYDYEMVAPEAVVFIKNLINNMWAGRMHPGLIKESAI